MKSFRAYISRSAIPMAARRTPTGSPPRTWTCSPASATSGSTTTKSSKKAVISSTISVCTDHLSSAQSANGLNLAILCDDFLSCIAEGAKRVAARVQLLLRSARSEDSRFRTYIEVDLFLVWKWVFGGFLHSWQGLSCET